MSAGDAYTIDRLSTTDAMLQVFDDLRTNRPKPLLSLSLASSRLNRGVSRSMPNMAVLQGTPTVPMELLYVSSANSSTLNMESVETVELPAASPTIVAANYASPDFRYDIGLVNVAVLKPTAAEVCDGIESVSSAPMPAEVKPAEVDAPQARSEIESPRRASSMPNMTLRFGELLKSEDSPTKKPADETTPSLQNPDILIDGRSDVARTETTTVTAVNPRRRRLQQLRSLACGNVEGGTVGLETVGFLHVCVLWQNF
ncbi:hypothetical protein QTP88_025532 [Uroleucon formosanum]